MESGCSIFIVKLHETWPIEINKQGLKVKTQTLTKNCVIVF